MTLITLDSAMKITGLSRRTLWRRLANDDASPTRARRGGGSSSNSRVARISLNCILPDLQIKLANGDESLVRAADAGEAEAQNDLALMLLAANNPDLGVLWLQDAAEQSYPDAMHWLGRCYIAGEGLRRDEALGLSWLGRAAAGGHVLSGELLQTLGVIHAQSAGPAAAGHAVTRLGNL